MTPTTGWVATGESDVKAGFSGNTANALRLATPDTEMGFRGSRFQSRRPDHASESTVGTSPTVPLCVYA
jgi:hypothetical protein